MRLANDGLLSAGTKTRPQNNTHHSKCTDMYTTIRVRLHTAAYTQTYTRTRSSRIYHIYPMHSQVVRPARPWLRRRLNHSRRRLGAHRPAPHEPTRTHALTLAHRRAHHGSKTAGDVLSQSKSQVMGMPWCATLSHCGSKLKTGTFACDWPEMTLVVCQREEHSRVRREGGRAHASAPAAFA